jgi:hypothetical protein
MGISTNYKKMREKFNPRYWGSIKEFEEYYLKEISERLPDTNYYTNEGGVEVVIPPINHHPKLKEYEIWSEGFVATGQSSGAIFWGKVKARNFAQACHILMCQEHLKQIKKENNSEYKKYTTPGRWDYNPQELSYWGCKLYWSEELAKKTFG